MTLLLLALLGCSEPADTRPDLMLVSIDTLRADHIGAWGDPAARTPWMDAVARLGTRFSRASTVSNNTLPAHVSMLSGVHPQVSGVPRNGHKLGPDAPWAPALLHQAGYETAAFVSASALSHKLGLDRGFDVYDDHFDIKEMDQRQRRGDATTEAAIDWLSQEHDGPVFTWIHLFDPHYPYTPPAPFDANPGGYSGPADGSMEYLLGVWGRGRPKVPATPADRARMIELYDGEIAWVDTQLGRLAQVAQDRDALLVVIGDHGESLTEHDYLFDHGQYLYQPGVHVPLIVRPPASWALDARVSDALAQSVDVAPTLLAAARVPATGLDGHDLMPIVRGQASAVRDVAFSESCRPWGVEKEHHGEYNNLYKAQSATRWPLKLIATPYQHRVELYDLEADPGELHDLSGERPAEVKALAAELEGWRGGAVKIGVPDAGNIEAIKALGYVE